VLALSSIQVALFIVPLVTLPYLARVLGEDALGAVLYAQSTAWLLGVLVEYGFNPSGARAVAAARDDRVARGRIAAGILGAKGLLAGGASVVMLAALATITKLRESPELLLLAWATAVAYNLSPTWWYFVGVERVRRAALIELGGRFAAAGLTFAFVRDEGDGWRFLALWAVTTVLSSLLVNTLMYRDIPFAWPRWSDAISALREGWMLFVGFAAVSMYTAGNIVLIGLFVPSAQVAHFAAAERVIRAMTRFVAPLVNSVYPRMAYLVATDAWARALRLRRASVWAVGGFGVTGAAALWALAPPIVKILYGSEFEESVGLLRVLCLVLPLIGLSGVLGSAWLLALSKDRTVTGITMMVAAVNLCLAVVLTPLYGPTGTAWGVVLAEATATVAVLAAVLRSNPALQSVQPVGGGIP
jgi:PST family polysaccharide transporter